MNWILPEGYCASPLLPEHEPAAVEVLNQYWQWLNGGNFTTLEEMHAEWQEPGFDTATDTQVVFAPDGKLVGYTDIYDVNTLHVRSFGLLALLPEQMGRGIEDYLLQWTIQRARENLPKAEEGARVVLHMSAKSACQPLCELYERHGMQVARNSYQMRIDFDQPPAAPVLPEGISIRPIVVGKEETMAMQTAYDAFRDHWGFVEQPFEDYKKRWMHHLENDPNYDPSLYFIAFDGTEVAGISLCYPKIEEAPELAWVGTLGVLRPWRKRGLGLALLQHSFQEFYRRGKRHAGLGVDAQNLTGALRLYEKAGMYVARKNSTYELELRPGKDLMRQNLE